MSFPATSLDPAGRLRGSQHTFCVVVKRLWEPHRTSVLITRVTGTGVPELFGLKWSDVELGRRLLCIRRRYYRTIRAPESPIMKGLRSSRAPKLIVEPFLQLMQGIQFSLSNSCSAAFLMTSESLYVTRRSSSRRAVSQKSPAFLSSSGMHLRRINSRTGLHGDAGGSPKCRHSSFHALWLGHFRADVWLISLGGNFLRISNSEM
jgi:hypothetical protein